MSSVSIPVQTVMATLLSGICASAQVKVRPAPPVLITTGIPQDPTDGDPGLTVQMLESPNIDLFLLRAQDLLSRDDFRGAIKILQDVVEGRTLEDTAENQGPAQGEGPATVWSDLIENSTNAVFSNDERLYRPVRRLCHELLAALPAPGIAFYRSTFEVAAERDLALARESGEVRLFEEVFNKWFITLTAARAMQTAGDLMMDQGTFRAAIQTYRLLLEIYPADGRRDAGVSDAYLRFRIALCYERLGDSDKALAELRALAEDLPEESLRLMGDLVAVTELPNSDLFRQNSVDVATVVSVGRSAIRSGSETLIPLWEHRFAEPSPYRPSRAAQNQRNSGGFVVVQDGTQGMTAAPRVIDYVPGTSVKFLGPHVAFLDHYRLRVTERLSGRMLLEAAREDGTDQPPAPRQGTPRSRVPAYDFSSLRVANDDERLYVVLGPKRKLQGMKPVLDNRLEAFRISDLEPIWSTKDRRGYDEVTMLATPTVFAGRLLVPVAQRSTYGMMCIDAASGEQVFHVHVHREGTAMARPPASPVAVHAGIAYLLTNAGALASVDAYTGALRWIRRYERTHPFRPAKTRRTRGRSGNMFGGRFFQEVAQYGFAPSELITHDGLVVFAPCDGRVMHCLDGATGEPIWMLGKRDIEFLIGHDGENLFAAGHDDVFCIGLHSGLRKWSAPLPDSGGNRRWRGRGVLTEQALIIPGSRALLVRGLEEHDEWQRLPLPSFSYGREPLAGPFNVQVDGAYLACVYESGIELYSTAEALIELADASEDLLQRSVYLSQAGELLQAIATLESIDLGEGAPAELIAEVPRRMLMLSSEMALTMAHHGARRDALELLDRCRPRLDRRRHIEHWHLARLEVFKALGDLSSIEQEQLALYEIMGRRDR